MESSLSIFSIAYRSQNVKHTFHFFKKRTPQKSAGLVVYLPGQRRAQGAAGGQCVLIGGLLACHRVGGQLRAAIASVLPVPLQ